MQNALHIIKESEKTELPSSQTGQGLFVSKKEFFSLRPLAQPQKSHKKRWSIDFSSLLHYREYIAGLAFMEDSLVYTLYRLTPEGISTDVSHEEPFPSPAVIDDSIDHNEQYASALPHIFSAVTEHPTRSVILSLPPRHIWITVLEFPKTLTKNLLTEAIHLYCEFSLPFSREEAYIDWEILDDHESGIQHVEIGAVLRHYIDPYLEILKKEKITAIAVESHLMSVARCLGNGHTLFVIIYPSGAHIGAYDDQRFRFQRFIPWEHIQKDHTDKKNLPAAILDEIRHTIHFLRTESHAPFETAYITLIAPEDFHNAFTIAIASDPLSALFKNEDEEIRDPGHTVARGAALRGLLPRKDDTIMSFTAMGTEKIYEWKRAISFSAFFEKLAMGLGIFFILLYGGSYVFVTILAQRVESRQIAQGSMYQDIVSIQNEAKRFNSAIDNISHLAERSPHWEKLFLHITRLSNPGITITSLSVDNPSSFALAGIAVNRDALLQFKASINSSGIFQDIELPFTLLVTKENIPFRFLLVFRDNKFLLSP